MTEALAVDELVQTLYQPLAARPDDRTGKHTQYTINDAALGALAVFCTQSPSLLASQRTLQQANGRRHAESLFGMAARPCDHQLRRLLDPVAPAQLFPVFEAVYAALEGAGQVSACRSFAGQRLMALDGTAYVSSPEMHGAHGSQRTHANGRVTSFHPAITPVMVAPGTHDVSTLAPEGITPPDGPAQQDGQQVAAKRDGIRRPPSEVTSATVNNPVVSAGSATTATASWSASRRRTPRGTSGWLG